jgi:preprotein translocase subunit SecF
MFVIKYRKIFYTFSALLVLLSVVSLSVWHLKLSIDFKGGALLEVAYPNGRPALDAVNAELKPLNVAANVVPTGTTGYIIRTQNLDETQHAEILQILSQNSTIAMDVKQFDTVGPVLGDELRGKSLVSIFLVIIAIVLFITYAFRKVSEPVSSWIYGLIAIVALLHDVIVPAGVFSILGHFRGIEVDTLFVTAILVILGFSIHDTIVVFDRTRENLKINKEAGKREPFDETVGRSVSQTFTRSINTSLTVVLTLLVLYFVGPETTRNFSLALLVGIVAGTYSSIFLGSPLLVTIAKWQENREKNSSKK